MNLIGTQGLFWLKASEISVSGHPPCFWVCVEAAHHGWECVVGQSCSPNNEDAIERKEGAEVQISPSRALPQ
jgi:hypothetical protein